MKLELIGKHPIRFLAFRTNKKKLGQRDKIPAINGQAVVRLPNTMLDMFDPNLRAFLFQKNATPNPQADIPNTTMELQELTPMAKALGSLHWAGEQGGSKIKVYQGATTDMDFTITGATLSKYLITPIEGGYFDWRFSFYSADNVDKELMGDVGDLVTESPEGEIIAPEVMADPQGDLIEDDGPAYTPEQALADAVAEDGTAAHGNAGKRLKQQRRAAKKAPPAKKVARSSRKAKAH